MVRDGKVVGSVIIGQSFSAPQYFHSRPSAAGTNGYDATSSSGSNLGPTNKSFIDTVRKRVKDEMESDPGRAGQFRSTRDGIRSGLDLEISPAAAEIQVAGRQSAWGEPRCGGAPVHDNTRGAGGWACWANQGQCSEA